MDFNLVKELREKTGAGMLDCKKALEETNGNIEKAIDWLREKGISKAIKKADRIAAEGLVNIKVKNNTGVIVELNSETDFVAQNDEFINLLDSITDILVENEVDTVERAFNIEINNETLEEMIINKIAKIGEKISLRRFERILKTDEENFGVYIHNNNKDACLLVMENGNEEIAKDVAMHATAMKPRYILKEDISEEEKNKEREIQKQLAINEGKPAEIAEKMVEGRLQKYFKEICLYEQQFVKNPDITVGQYLKDFDAKIMKMIRYEVGEGMEKRKDNFAEEVMSQMR